MNTKLVAVLLLGVASFALVGCDDDKKPEEAAVKIYKSVSECQEDNNSETDCQTAIEGARTIHETNVPHIPTREECVAKYGVDACIERHDNASGNSWFVPAMTGFMIGHMMAGSMTPNYQPVYIDRHGSAFTGTTSLGNYRSSCADPYSACRSSGYVAVAPRATWNSGYRTTTVITTSVPGKPSVAVPAESVRGGFGRSATTMATGSVGKSPPTGSASPAAVSAPRAAISGGTSSVRGGFGGRAGGISVGG